MEHSYTSASQIDYVSNKFSRISAIVPESKFVDPVHELLKGIVYRNEYDLKETFVHHVGYIGKLSDKKAKRNQQIMNKELEKNPGNFHLWLQQIAGAGDDEKEMLKFSEKAISTLKSRELDDWNITDWIEIFFTECVDMLV